MADMDSARPAPARAVQLLAAAGAAVGVHARLGQRGWDFTPLPTEAAWLALGLPLPELAAALPRWLNGAATPGRFTVELAPLPRRTFFSRFEEQRELIIFRLDQAPIPQELLLVPQIPARRSASQPAGLRHLLLGQVRHEAPLPHLGATPAMLRNWEHLADALGQGLLVCDPAMVIHYVNESALTRFGLGKDALLGRPLLSLPWDAATRDRLTLLAQQGGRGVLSATCTVAGRPLEFDCTLTRIPNESVLLECAFPAPERRPSGIYRPLDSTDPPPTPSVPHKLQWLDDIALQTIPARAEGISYQRTIPLGGGAVGVCLLHVPEAGPEWDTWAQAVLAAIEQHATPLATAQEVLDAVSLAAQFPLIGDRSWAIGYGRIQAGFRSVEWGAIGGAGLLTHDPATGCWSSVPPERVLHLGFGCPPLRLCLLQGEIGDAILFHVSCGDETPERQLIDWTTALPTPMRVAPWAKIRRALGLEPSTTAPLPSTFGGGLLLRISAGRREQLALHPSQFEVFTNTLKLRLRAGGIDDHTLFQVRIALDEILTNASRHGHIDDREIPVEVEVLLEPGCLRVTIEDAGTGFDLIRLKDPTAPEEILEPGGRGVFLTAKLMDQVEYGAGTNRVTLTKYFG